MSETGRKRPAESMPSEGQLSTLSVSKAVIPLTARSRLAVSRPCQPCRVTPRTRRSGRPTQPAASLSCHDRRLRCNEAKVIESVESGAWYQGSGCANELWGFNDNVFHSGVSDVL
jgi:hypothetical protein